MQTRPRLNASHALSLHRMPCCSPAEPPHHVPQMEDLASEVTEKIKRLELLAAENEALQGHERLLKQTIAARDGVLQLLSGHQPQQQAQAPKRVKQQNAEAAPQHYGAHISNEAADSPVAAAGCADPSSCSASSSANSAGGASSSGSGNGALGGGAQASGDDSMPFCFQEMTAEEQAKVDAFFRRYKEHMEHALKERLQPDGVVLPLPAGDARRERFLEMLQDACTWPVHTVGTEAPEVSGRRGRGLGWCPLWGAVGGCRRLV